MEIAGPIIVTGSSGFVGRALAARLGVPFESLSLGAADWLARIQGADFRSATIFHLAARVHGTGHGDEAAYRRDNVDKTRVLATHAENGGARRLVFLSSIKVNGDETNERPFRADDVPRPGDAYARSKWEAERELAAIAAQGRLEVAIVRSPLVYGPSATGNLRALLRLADTPWPLPFRSIRNHRSFVHVDDLARLLVACAVKPEARGATFLAASSGSAPSTPRIVSLMRAAFGRPARLLRFPVTLLEASASAVGQGERMRRLTRSLEIDATPAERELGWKAAIPIEDAIAQMVAAHRGEAPA